MVAELLRGEEEMRAFVELLRPEQTADGFESDERLVICGVSWERYLALDKALREISCKLRGVAQQTQDLSRSYESRPVPGKRSSGITHEELIHGQRIAAFSKAKATAVKSFAATWMLSSVR